MDVINISYNLYNYISFKMGGWISLIWSLFSFNSQQEYAVHVFNQFSFYFDLLYH